MSVEFRVQNLLVSMFLLVLVFDSLTKTVFAQTICDDVYYIDGQTGQCIRKHGDFDPDIGDCAYAFDPVVEGDAGFDQCPFPVAVPSPTPAVSPSPSESPTPVSSSSIPLGPEERAIYNFNVMLPKEAINDRIEEGNILKRLLKKLGDLVSRVLFIYKIQNNEKTYTHSESLYQSKLPPELKPAGSNPGENLQDFLGGSTGIYGVKLPKEIQNQSIQSSEKAFENANFPEGVHPITGSTP